MTAVFKVDGASLPNGAILMGEGITGLPSAAWYCEPGVGEINIDDPDGLYEFAGWHTFTVDETACTGRERVWSGWLVGRRITRGPYRTGPGRVWVVAITDINTLFSFEVFRANSAQRPAETDVARMQWLIASDPMAGTPVHDDGRFSTAGPANLPAAEFVRSYPVEMASDAAGQSNKNVYAYWDHAGDEIGFHYDLLDHGPACSLTVSNVMADVDGATCFYPFLDAELDADAYGRFTGALVDYVSGSVYGRNDDLVDELSPTEFSPVNFLRDEIIRSDRIGKASTASAFLDTYLAEAAKEREDITLMIRLPAALVNYVEAGMNIDVKLVHLPGLEDFTTLPIVRLSKLPSPGRRDTWDVRLDLSTNSRPTVSVGAGPGPGVTVPPDPPIWDLGDTTVLATHDFGDAIGKTKYQVDLDGSTSGEYPGFAAFRAEIDSRGITTGPVVSGGHDVEFRVVALHEVPEDLVGQVTHARIYGRIFGVSDTWETGVPTAQQLRYNLLCGASRQSGLVISGTDLLEANDHDDFDIVVVVAGNTVRLEIAFGSQPLVNMSRIVAAVQVNDDQLRYPATPDGNPGPSWAALEQLWTLPPSGTSITEAYRLDWLGAPLLVPPSSGFHVSDEFVAYGDGVTVDFATDHAYAPGSMSGRVDSEDVTIVEDDATLGTFHLLFAMLPSPGAEQLFVSYVVA